MSASIVPLRAPQPEPPDHLVGEPRWAVSHPDLPSLRQEIDAVDASLMELLARRVELCRTLGQVKAHAGLPVLDPVREAQVVATAGRRAREVNVPEEGVRTLFWSLLALSRAAQERDR